MRDRPKELDLEGLSAFAWEMAAPLPAGTPAAGYLQLKNGGKLLAQTYLYAPADDPSFEKSGDGTRRTRRRGSGRRGWDRSRAGRASSRLLYVEPGRKYRLTVAGRRSGDKGNMYVLLRLRSAAQGWQYARADFPAGVFGQWVKLSAEFTVPADMAEADVYLYNMDSEATVDYDDIRVEMIE